MELDISLEEARRKALLKASSNTGRVEEESCREEIEAIDVIDSWGLGYCAGNVVRHIAAYQYGETPLEELKKAKWYLDHLIEVMSESQ